MVSKIGVQFQSPTAKVIGGRLKFFAISLVPRVEKNSLLNFIPRSIEEV
jgi:hypothetical protein